MEDRLDRIRRERKLKGLTWSDLAEGLPVSGEAIRVAFYRGHVDEVYLDQIEMVLGISEKRTERTAAEPDTVPYSAQNGQNHVTVEDLVAQKVVQLLRPFLREKTDEILAQLMDLKKSEEDIKKMITALHIDVNLLRNKQEATLQKATEVLSQSEQTFKKTEDTYKKVLVIEERH